MTFKDDTLKALTDGYHKTALALREVSVKQSSCQAHVDARIKALEQAVHTGSFSIQSRLAVLETRMAAYDRAQNGASANRNALAAAKVGSRGTILAAWIGGSITLLAAIASLIISLQ